MPSGTAAGLSHGSEEWKNVENVGEGLILWKGVRGIGEATAQLLVDEGFWTEESIPALRDRDFVREEFGDLSAGIRVTISGAAANWFPVQPAPGTPSSAAHGDGHGAHWAGGRAQKPSQFPAWPSTTGWPTYEEQRVLSSRVKGWAMERPHLTKSILSIISDPNSPIIDINEDDNHILYAIIISDQTKLPSSVISLIPSEVEESCNGLELLKWLWQQSKSQGLDSEKKIAKLNKLMLSPSIIPSL